MVSSRRLFQAAAAGGILLTLMAGLQAAQRESAGSRPTEARLADRLDPLFQERFRDLSEIMFGIRRLPATPEHNELIVLKPDRPAERRLLRELEAEGWRAAFYVAGASVRERVRPPAPSRPEGEGLRRADRMDRRGVSEPIVLAGVRDRKALPRGEQLIPQAAAAFEALRTAERRSFTVGDWRVEARPVRASSERCAACHRQQPETPDMRVGDLIGVAMYAFSRAPAR